MAKTCERYERYNFNATEDDYTVCNILLGLQSLIEKSDPSPSISPAPFSWGIKRKRSAINSAPPSPLAEPQPITHSVQNHQQTHSHKNQERLHSPSSPLGYSPNQAHNDVQSNHQPKRKSKKRKLKDWEDHVENLKQTKEQLILTLDNVKKYQRTVLEFNIMLKAKRDELKGHIPKQSNVNLNVQNHQLHHPFPVFAQQQQQQLEYTVQPGMTLYYPAPFFPSSNGAGMRIMEGYGRPDDKALRAAEARRRRRLQLNQKKNSVGTRKLN